MAHVETVCPLEGRLKSFEALYWWLEYWGDWALDGTRGRVTILERLEKYGEERILSTAPESFPEEIRLIERALAQLRLEDRFRFRVVAMLHIGKASFLDIQHAYGIRRRGVERTLWRSYYYLDPKIAEAGLYQQPARIYGT